ncbi:MAG: Fic family protein [bacterium]
MYLSKKTIRLLDERLQELSSLRPIPPTILQKTQERFEVEMTYNSNAIEGNSLSLKETYWVIQEGLTIKEKPLKDHLEAKNQKEALDFLYQLVDERKRIAVNENLIKLLHNLVIFDSDREIAGKYRKGEVAISGSKHIPVRAYKIKPEMAQLITWLQQNKKNHHVVELAALLHYKFVSIHPFWDGNGRTARLIMNVLLMKAGYPLSIILKTDRKKYYRVLERADNGDPKPLCEFIARSVIRSLNIYLSSVQTSQNSRDRFISLENLSKKTKYSAAYLKKLAGLGKLEAYKENRNWLSTERALQDYIQNRERKRG